MYIQANSYELKKEWNDAQMHRITFELKNYFVGEIAPVMLNEN